MIKDLVDRFVQEQRLAEINKSRRFQRARGRVARAPVVAASENGAHEPGKASCDPLPFALNSVAQNAPNDGRPPVVHRHTNESRRPESPEHKMPSEIQHGEKQNALFHVNENFQQANITLTTVGKNVKLNESKMAAFPGVAIGEQMPMIEIERNHLLALLERSREEKFMISVDFLEQLKGCPKKEISPTSVGSKNPNYKKSPPTSAHAANVGGSSDVTVTAGFSTLPKLEISTADGKEFTISDSLGGEDIPAAVVSSDCNKGAVDARRILLIKAPSNARDEKINSLLIPTIGQLKECKSDRSTKNKAIKGKITDRVTHMEGAGTHQQRTQTSFEAEIAEPKQRESGKAHNGGNKEEKMTIKESELSVMKVTPDGTVTGRDVKTATSFSRILPLGVHTATGKEEKIRSTAELESVNLKEFKIVGSSPPTETCIVTANKKSPSNIDSKDLGKGKRKIDDASCYSDIMEIDENESEFRATKDTILGTAESACGSAWSKQNSNSLDQPRPVELNRRNNGPSSNDAKHSTMNNLREENNAKETSHQAEHVKVVKTFKVVPRSSPLVAQAFDRGKRSHSLPGPKIMQAKESEFYQSSSTANFEHKNSEQSELMVSQDAHIVTMPIEDAEIPTSVNKSLSLEGHSKSKPLEEGNANPMSSKETLGVLSPSNFNDAKQAVPMEKELVPEKDHQSVGSIPLEPVEVKTDPRLCVSESVEKGSKENDSNVTKETLCVPLPRMLDDTRQAVPTEKGLVTKTDCQSVGSKPLEAKEVKKIDSSLNVTESVEKESQKSCNLGPKNDTLGVLSPRKVNNARQAAPKEKELVVKNNKTVGSKPLEPKGAKIDSSLSVIKSVENESKQSTLGSTKKALRIILRCKVKDVKQGMPKEKELLAKKNDHVRIGSKVLEDAKSDQWLRVREIAENTSKNSDFRSTTRKSDFRPSKFNDAKQGHLTGSTHSFPPPKTILDDSKLKELSMVTSMERLSYARKSPTSSEAFTPKKRKGSYLLKELASYGKSGIDSKWHKPKVFAAPADFCQKKAAKFAAIIIEQLCRHFPKHFEELRVGDGAREPLKEKYPNCLDGRPLRVQRCYYKTHLNSGFVSNDTFTSWLPKCVRIKSVVSAEPGIAFVSTLSATQSHTHYDQDTAFLLVLTGVKEIFYAPPSLGRELRKLDEHGVLTHSSIYDNVNPFLEARGTSWKFVVLKAGEGLLVPKGWLHAVKSSPGTVAVSFQVESVGHDGTSPSRNVRLRCSTMPPEDLRHLDKQQRKFLMIAGSESRYPSEFKSTTLPDPSHLSYSLTTPKGLLESSRQDSKVVGSEPNSHLLLKDQNEPSCTQLARDKDDVEMTKPIARTSLNSSQSSKVAGSELLSRDQNEPSCTQRDKDDVEMTKPIARISSKSTEVGKVAGSELISHLLSKDQNEPSCIQLARDKDDVEMTKPIARISSKSIQVSKVTGSELNSHLLLKDQNEPSCTQLARNKDDVEMTKPIARISSKSIQVSKVTGSELNSHLLLKDQNEPSCIQLARDKDDVEMTKPIARISSKSTEVGKVAGSELISHLLSKDQNEPSCTQLARDKDDVEMTKPIARISSKSIQVSKVTGSELNSHLLLKDQNEPSCTQLARNKDDVEMTKPIARISSKSTEVGKVAGSELISHLLSKDQNEPSCTQLARDKDDVEMTKPIARISSKSIQVSKVTGSELNSHLLLKDQNEPSCTQLARNKDDVEMTKPIARISSKSTEVGKVAGSELISHLLSKDQNEPSCTQLARDKDDVEMTKPIARISSKSIQVSKVTGSELNSHLLLKDQNEPSCTQLARNKDDVEMTKPIARISSKSTEVGKVAGSELISHLLSKDQNEPSCTQLARDKDDVEMTKPIARISSKSIQVSKVTGSELNSHLLLKDQNEPSCTQLARNKDDVEMTKPIARISSKSTEVGKVAGSELISHLLSKDQNEPSCTQLARDKDDVEMTKPIARISSKSIQVSKVTGSELNSHLLLKDQNERSCTQLARNKDDVEMTKPIARISSKSTVHLCEAQSETIACGDSTIMECNADSYSQNLANQSIHDIIDMTNDQSSDENASEVSAPWTAQKSKVHKKAGDHADVSLNRVSSACRRQKKKRKHHNNDLATHAKVDRITKWASSSKFTSVLRKQRKVTSKARPAIARGLPTKKVKNSGGLVPRTGRRNSGRIKRLCGVDGCKREFLTDGMFWVMTLKDIQVGDLPNVPTYHPKHLVCTNCRETGGQQMISPDDLLNDEDQKEIKQWWHYMYYPASFKDYEREVALNG